jgi:hypothetical protein
MGFDPDEFIASARAGGPAKGGGFDPDEFISSMKPRADSGGLDPQAAIQGIGQAASMGYVPELTGIAQPTAKRIGDLVTGGNQSGESTLGKIANLVKLASPLGQLHELYKAMHDPEYQSAVDDSRAMQKKMAEESPVSYYGGQVVGALASAPALGGAMKAAGIAKEVPALATAADAPLLQKAAAYGKNLGGRMLQAGKEGAVLGAAANPNTEVGDEGLNVGKRLGNAAMTAGFSAALPVATDAVKGSIQGGKNLAGWTATKTLSNLGGVKPEVIKEYAKFSERINSAPSVDALKEISDNFVGKLAQDVDAAKLTHQEAQEAYKSFQADLRDQFQKAGYDARDALTSAKQTLKDAHGARIQQLSGDVYDAINKLKGDVQAGSGRALQTLDESGAKVGLQPVMDQIDSQIARLQQAGTDESLAVADKLKAYKERLAQHLDTTQVGFQPAGKLEQVSPARYERTPDELRASGKPLPARYLMGNGNEDQWLKMGLLGKEVAPAVEVQPIGPKFGSSAQIEAPAAKKLIQGLDQVTEYSPLAGSFDKAKNAAFKGVRGTLDETLKDTVPAYREAMKPVAADASLLNKISDFGDRQAAASLLQRIDQPNQIENRQALEALGKKYGIDFLAGTKPENLPEFARVQEAQGKLEALRPDRVSQKIEERLAGSGQKAQLESASAKVAEAEKKLAPFGSLAPNKADQTTVQGKLMKLAQGKDIELKDMFKELGKLTNTDFVQAMRDNGIKAAFEKGAYNGSRNTVMGAVVGWAFGPVGGLVGGAAAGRAIDQWGPAITKKILDGAIAVSKNPAVSTIAKLDIPPEAKRNMIIGLENYLSKESGSAVRPQMVAEKEDSNRKPAKSRLER